MMKITKILQEFEKIHTDDETQKMNSTVQGWIRTARSSSPILMFCLINDGSNASGLQLIFTSSKLSEEELDYFSKSAKTGCFISANGEIVKSPGKGQICEMVVTDFKINSHIDGKYPLAKSKMNLDTLRNHIDFRSRTSTFGSVFRIRSKLTKAVHDYYHMNDFHHIDPNIITINECEGGAGVFQITEKNMSSLTNLPFTKEGLYQWENDHFNRPTYLTVSSQLQLEIFSCSLGDVYTMNKSFRSEHSGTNKHCSEFTHLEIEIVDDSMDRLMDIAESTIKHCIMSVMRSCDEDIKNLDNFVSPKLIERLETILSRIFIKKTYTEVVEEINADIIEQKLELDPLVIGDDLGSRHEDYITSKYNTGVFCTHWPLAIKSFYMKQYKDTDLCESFDLLMPYGIGELIGGSMREENYDKLITCMRNKHVDESGLEFYTNLRKYGTCPHGGYGLGFERLLMLMTGMKNIRDVLPVPVCYKDCKY